MKSVIILNSLKFNAKSEINMNREKVYRYIDDCFHWFVLIYILLDFHGYRCNTLIPNKNAGKQQFDPNQGTLNTPILTEVMDRWTGKQTENARVYYIYIYIYIYISQKSK